MATAYVTDVVCIYGIIEQDDPIAMQGFGYAYVLADDNGLVLNEIGFWSGAPVEWRQLLGYNASDGLSTIRANIAADLRSFHSAHTPFDVVFMTDGTVL